MDIYLRHSPNDSISIDTYADVDCVEVSLDTAFPEQIEVRWRRGDQKYRVGVTFADLIAAWEQLREEKK
jgi:hypothetical protein